MNKAVQTLSPFKMFNFLSSRTKRKLPFFLLLLFQLLFSSNTLHSQASIQITVLDGGATTTCTGPFGLAPVVQWSVDINGQGEEIYPTFANCFNNVPNVQYTYIADCPWQAPSTLEICFKAFENEALFCNVSEDCSESICQTFDTPTLANSATDVTIELPDGLDSDGFVELRIELIGSFIADTNEEPCTASDMGSLLANTSIGSLNQSQYNNNCANVSGAAPAPAPGTTTVVDNVGLWYQFETGNEPIDLLSVQAISDPENLGDPVNLQLVLYKVENGDCNNLQFLSSDYDESDDNAFIYLNCLEANSTYMVLVDGTFASSAGITGFFDLQIKAETITQAPNFICDAENLGIVPDGGSVEATLLTNNCANAIDDPIPSSFNLNQSVWFSFAAPASGNVIINANNHIPSIGNEVLDLQIAVFETSDNDCASAPSEIASSYSITSMNESLEVECLEEGQQYWILIDGATDIVAAAFDISVTDGGNFPPEISTTLLLCFDESHTVGNNTYLEAGMYSDTLVAFNGCDSIIHTDLSFATLLEANLMEINPAMLETTLDGSATANPSGGNPTYSYQWDNGATTQSIQNVAAGIYCVTITDELGCSAEDCVEIFYIGAIVAQITSDALNCFGDSDGTLTLSSTGGTPPYNYTWENEADDSQGNGVLDNEGDNVELSNLTAGTYTFTLTDTENLETTISTTISQPDLVETSLNPVLCFGESLMIGNTNYTSEGNINEMLQTNNGCDSLITGFLTILPNNVFQNPILICAGDSYEIGTSSYNSTGMYEDILTDANTCDSTVMTELTVLEAIDLEIIIDQEASGYQANDANASLVIYGGTGNYNINWDNGETQDNVTALEGGTPICVTVTDDLNCMNEICALVPYSADNLGVLSARDALCWETNTGTLILEAGLGRAPYTYQWEETNSATSGNGALADGEVLEIPNLAQGMYQVTLTDANTISTVLMTEIVAPDRIEVSTQVLENPTCLGDCNAQFSIDIIGGTGEYFFNWSDTNISSNAANNLCANDYLVTITDGNGCTALHSISITEPAALEVTVVEEQAVSCFEGSNGQATVSSNVDILQVQWDNGETSEMATQLDAGIHQVSILDINGCQATSTVEITAPTAPVDVLLEQQNSVTCNGEADGAILATSSGPGDAFIFHWNDSVNGKAETNSFLASGLSAGIYTVTINNELGCTATQSIEITEPELLTFDLATGDADCSNEGNSGSIEILNVQGGTGPFMYSVDGINFLSSAEFQTLPAGNYELSVQDIEGCTNMNSATILPPPNLDVSIPTFNQITLGESIQFSPIVNSDNATFNWISSDPSLDCLDCASITIQPTINTEFLLEVMDSITFCSNAIEFTVDVNVIRNIFIPNAFSPNDDGINDYFLPKVGIGVQQIKDMMVFDRQGNMVFQGQDFSPHDDTLGWTGKFRNKDLPQGVYVYSMLVEYVDGEVIQYKGDVSIIF